MSQRLEKRLCSALKIMEDSCEECLDVTSLSVCEGDEPGKYQDCKCLKIRQMLAELDFKRTYKLG